MLFWSKKRVEEVNPTYDERLRKIETRINLLSAEILDIATAQTIIRDKVLRKIQFKKAPEEEEDTKNTYSSVLLPER